MTRVKAKHITICNSEREVLDSINITDRLVDVEREGYSINTEVILFSEYDKLLTEKLKLKERIEKLAGDVLHEMAENKKLKGRLIEARDKIEILNEAVFVKDLRLNEAENRIDELKKLTAREE